MHTRRSYYGHLRRTWLRMDSATIQRVKVSRSWNGDTGIPERPLTDAEELLIKKRFVMKRDEPELDRCLAVADAD